MEVEKVAGLPPQFAERIQPYVSEVEWPALAADIRAGRSELFSIDGGISLCVTRFDSATKELVICAYQGRDVMNFARILKEVAIKNGASTMRYHCRRRGMARLLSELGAVESETVYRVIF